MIIGVGTDIVKIHRIARAIQRTPNFIKSGFSDNEINYFTQRKNNPETVAGVFAGKEAVSKALGTGFRGFGLKDIEITHDENGKPIGKLSEKLLLVCKLKQYTLHISISHTSDEAIAFAVLEERGE